ncbi:Apoptosis-inducing factor 1, mitochondrial [Quaeritorhiza haematococci]|nr:Apoptosis-inducing factor 1, mitochondrial [Quaeritorhiza haematococci]
MASRAHRSISLLHHTLKSRSPTTNLLRTQQYQYQYTKKSFSYANYATSSFSSHASHGAAAAAGHAGTSETRRRLLLLGSALVFGPALWYFTEPEGAKARRAVAKSKSQEPTTPPPAPAPVAPSPAPTGVARDKSLPYVKYVLVGAGTASFSALETIREKEPNADVLIIGEESYVPYMRPPLSKELWFDADIKELKFKDWSGNERSIWYQSPASYETVVSADALLTPPAASSSKPKPRWLKNAKVVKLDVEKQQIILADGKKIQYDKVL